MHEEARKTDLTCMKVFGGNLACNDFRRCITCQALKGNQWQKDCYPMFMEAISSLKGLIPDWWGQHTNTTGEELGALKFLAKHLNNVPTIRKVLSHRGAVRLQQQAIVDLCEKVRAHQTHYTFNTVFVESSAEQTQESASYFFYMDVGNYTMGRV